MEKKEVYQIKPLTENNKNIIKSLIEEYEIETAEDIQEALKDLLGGTIKSTMEAKLTDILAMKSPNATTRTITTTARRRKTFAAITANLSLKPRPQDRATAALSRKLSRNVRKTYQK
jgi:putative transposase